MITYISNVNNHIIHIQAKTIFSEDRNRTSEIMSYASVDMFGKIHLNLNHIYPSMSNNTLYGHYDVDTGNQIIWIRPDEENTTIDNFLDSYHDDDGVGSSSDDDVYWQDEGSDLGYLQ